MKKSTKSTEKHQTTKRKSKGFEPIYSNVAGIDVGSSLIHVAILNEKSEFDVREFGSMTPDLLEIASWLLQSGITTAAMEATGVYWIPLFEILEDKGIKAVLVDPKTVKNVPGRKTDYLDAQWIHKLYSCGLLTPAFRPAKDKEAFRSFMRHRGNLINGRQKAILQMNKALLLMNIKLDVVVSEVASVTGINIIRAIVEGEQDPCKLAALRHKSCKKPEEMFVDALTGNFQKTHLFTLKQSLETFDYFSRQIDECDEMIQDELQSWPTVVNGPVPPKKKDRNKRPPVAHAKKPDQNEFNFDIESLLYQKTGVDLTAVNALGSLTVATIISELGGRQGVNAFETENHWTSWLTLCPGNNVSGGKRLGGQSRKSKNRIKRALCTAAMSLCNAKCSLGAFYRRMAARISKSKALKAVAHKLARLIYQLLKKGHAYVEVGQELYEKRYKEKRLKNLVKNARELGFELIAA
ncbi:MAG: IS110 family transposase [Verrucomicrobia bacterium]|nr:IS110 family transposase [Verrucomicrobiota bacterium]